MKKLIRKLFMIFFHEELIVLKKYAMRSIRTECKTDSDILVMCGEIKGVLHALETLELLV